MVRVDLRVARALTHLSKPEMQPLLAYLKAQRLDVLEQMSQVSVDSQVYRLQGEAGSLKRLIEMIEGADALLTKLQK